MKGKRAINIWLILGAPGLAAAVAAYYMGYLVISILLFAILGSIFLLGLYQAWFVYFKAPKPREELGALPLALILLAVLVITFALAYLFFPF